MATFYLLRKKSSASLLMSQRKQCFLNIAMKCTQYNTSVIYSINQSLSNQGLMFIYLSVEVGKDAFYSNIKQVTQSFMPPDVILQLYVLSFTIQ